MTAATTCRTCGTEPLENAQFCHSCGSPITPTTRPAEYKQVTVLFVDVVHSMDIAGTVDAERLREIMTELFDRTAKVVHRYGGTVDKFTGDGVMALFGAPVALEDHALRACLAALDIQRETARTDGVTLQLRVGLSSGEVVAGEIGSGPGSYTAIGAQVGMAQRMESVAPPGGVMLSESTARLVEHVAALGEPELVHIKGSDEPVRARRLLAGHTEHEGAGRHDPALVGRRWEMSTLGAILDEAIAGKGCVVGVVGPPGIGKSRTVHEATAIANDKGVEVFSTYCESHTSEVPFHAVARLLRAAFRVDKLDDDAAREVIRVRVPGNADDLLLLDDLLGIRDTDIALPDITPDARRRRLTALVNAAALARTEPAMYIIEDAHWIDDVSESMLAEFMAVTPRTPSLVLITYRPVYRGVLARAAGSHTITLAPLDDSQVAALTAELLGPHPSVAGLATRVAERAAGNPFFAQEIVRDLAERGVIVGDRGRYVRVGDSDDVSVPATLKAAIASRIDRLDATSKSTLNAAAVIGSRFSADLLSRLHQNIAVAELIDAELVDQVMFAPHAEYEFHHPLIRTVAYESQLKSDRADLHRRLAGEIQVREPDSHDENAALIATHLEAAGDLHDAFHWHMRAGSWAEYRDFGAARFSWERARQVADRLPTDDPERMSMRIAPRALLCGSVWRVGGSVADTGFDELRELCMAAGDQVSLATGMAGHITVMTFHSRYHELPTLTAQFVELLESIGDPVLTVGLLFAAIWPKQEPGEAAEGLRLAQRLIDLADGDPAKGNLLLGSPLAAGTVVRGTFRIWLGSPDWKDDIDEAIAMARAFDPTSRAIAVMLKCVGVTVGAMLPDVTVMRESAEILEVAEQSGDEFALANARFGRGLALVHRDGPDRDTGFELLALAREAALNQRFIASAPQMVDIEIATQKARTGDLDGAIELSRAVTRTLLDKSVFAFYGHAAIGLVASLLRRGSVGDRQEAEAVIDRLADLAKESGLALHEAWLLHGRALMTQASGDNAVYRECVESYRAKAEACGYAGHLAMAEEMARAL